MDKTICQYYCSIALIFPKKYFKYEENILIFLGSGKRTFGQFLFSKTNNEVH